MDVKQLKGIAVVAVSDGARLGAVNDVLFDTESRHVKAFIVGSGGFFGGNDRILDMSDVKSIGADAIMIASRDELVAERDDARYRRFPNFGKMTSLRVVSESGVLLGNLATVQIDPADGRLTDIEVSQHGLFAAFRSNVIVPADAVIRFGQDVAVVPDQYAESMSKPTEEGPSKETSETTDKADIPPAS